MQRVIHPRTLVLLVVLSTASPALAQKGTTSATPPRVSAPRIDRQALTSLLASAEAAHSDAVVLRKDGQLVGAWYFGRAPKRIEAMSVTKSVVNLAIGRLVTTGAIPSVDIPIYTYYPEWKQGRKAHITLRHLLNHTSGLQNVPNTTVEIYPSPDFVQLALAAELVDDPGARFSYNNKAVNLLAGVVQKVSGKQVDAYLRDDLFAALGITDFSWTLDRTGNPHAMAGLQILPEDLAKLGQLVLDRGVANGKRLIAPEWFEESLRGSLRNPRYGLLWGLLPETTTWILDDAHIGALRSAGADTTFLNRLEMMRGRYHSSDSFVAAQRQAFGPEFQGVISSALARVRMNFARVEYGKIIGYEASGYLGQYMVIYPGQGIVAVRMISGSRDYNPQTDNFSRFSELVRALSPTGR